MDGYAGFNETPVFLDCFDDKFFRTFNLLYTESKKTSGSFGHTEFVSNRTGLSFYTDPYSTVSTFNPVYPKMEARWTTFDATYFTIDA